MKNQRKLKNYLINKNFQIKFLLYSMIPTAMFFIAIYISVNIYFDNMLKAGEAQNLPADHLYYSLINDQRQILQSSFLISFPFYIIFFSFWGIVVSHKIAGPLYRLSKHLKECKENKEIKKLSFRPNDLFLEIPELFNDYQSILMVRDNEKSEKIEEVDEDEIPPLPPAK